VFLCDHAIAVTRQARDGIVQTCAGEMRVLEADDRWNAARNEGVAVGVGIVSAEPLERSLSRLDEDTVPVSVAHALV
jgi:hypothetical protein